LKEPLIREKLNGILKKALIEYSERNHQAFFNSLFREYDEEMHTYFLKFKKCKDSINPEEIIEMLLNYDFRPNGVAYLLNLIGEVLISRKIKIKGKTTRDLKSLASLIFTVVSKSKELTEKVKMLDDRIQDLRKSDKENYISYIKSRFNKVKDFVMLKVYSDIAQQYKEDSLIISFQSRLDEMHNTVRLNIMIADVIEGSSEEIK